MSATLAPGILLRLAAGQIDDRWSASVEDHSVGAWIAIGLYFLNAFLGLRRSEDWPAPGAYEPRARTAWLALAGCMLLLGLTRLFDLGNLATVIGRQIAVSEGFYGERRALQVLVIGVLAMAALWATLWLCRPGPTFSHRLRLALAGTAFLVFFAAVRAISFHYLDILLGLEWEGIRLSWIPEIGAAALVAAAAAVPSSRESSGQR